VTADDAPLTYEVKITARDPEQLASTVRAFAAALADDSAAGCSPRLAPVIDLADRRDRPGA
jgi:hypothetical protein